VVSSATEIATIMDRLTIREGLNPMQREDEWILNQYFLEQMVKIGGQLSGKAKAELKEILLDNIDVFALQHNDITGVSRDLAEHKLNTYPASRPVRQKKRPMCIERGRATCEETRKLLDAGIVREVLANPVMVGKGDGSWRMCIDFKDINNACPKDCYPLPEIDAKIDALAGYPLRCFLDAYEGYHQIQMAEEDEDKTAFYTDDAFFAIQRCRSA
jgi:hypothetical protein